MKINMKEWIASILGSEKRIAIPVMTHSGIELLGHTVYDAVTNGEIHARAVKLLAEKYPSAASSVIMDLTVEAEGDLEVDTHHTIEDIGIVLGTAIHQAVGSKEGIVRYGTAILPMDEALILCSLDLCGRPYLGWDLTLDREFVGDLETEMIKEFFYAVSYSGAMNLHLKVLDGGNNHHMAEALFKAFGKALDMAVSEEPRMKEVWSTKGSL